MTDNFPQPNDGFAWVQARAEHLLVCRALEPVARHGFTTRAWHDWPGLADAMGVDSSQLLRAHQVHGAAVVVHRAGRARAGSRVSHERADADILVTNDGEAAIAVQTADCVPVLIADRRGGVVAAAHAGWRGLAVRVPQVAVTALVREFGSRPEDLVVAVGPSIGACCYEVGSDLRDVFVEAGFTEADLARWFFDLPQPTGVNPSMPALPPHRRPAHWFFDGWSAARDQLAAAGVHPSNIHVAELCTASHPDTFCSYRRDGKGAGRIAAAIRSLDLLS